MNENTVEKDISMPEGAIVNTGAEGEEKMFTQSQLEEILSERLSRERRINEALSPVKAFLKSAAQKGLVSGASYAEMAKELMDKLGGKKEEASTVETAVQTSQEQAAPKDTASVADEAGDNEEQVFGNDVNAEQSGKESAQKDDFMSVLCDVKEKYGRDGVMTLLSDGLFERFAKGRSEGLRQVIDEYLYFVGALSERAEKASAESRHSALSSTAFSSQAAAVAPEVSLTKQQMEMAKSEGMSYREYARLLESVPKRTGRTF